MTDSLIKLGNEGISTKALFKKILSNWLLKMLKSRPRLNEKRKKTRGR